MRITERDDVNHIEAVRLTALEIRIGARQARGINTARLERAADRILDRAADREARKEDIRAAAVAAKEKARHDAKKKRAVDRATRKYR